MAKSKKVVLGVTGSIAAYKSADIIRRLCEKGFSVSVVMTKEAEEFITPLTLSALCGEEVYRETFANGAFKMPHIVLAQQADVFLIAPATAAIIGKLAYGIADNLLTCVALATRARILLAPAMNTEMYTNKIVRENCSKLKKQGAHFIDPISGKLACGTVGEGHLAEVDTIVDAVVRAVK
ncbi:MAG: phosphopantothenoylcysteine decarboxylase [Candidatus Omnitrophica bacterium]|nr:phosphopantothenoylcysteine decarboxylase [Candidatus Omnitrophota bacterium]